MLKKIWFNIRTFFIYLFLGMKNANDVAFTGQKDVALGDSKGIEQQKETNSVYKDLLKGELTQEVIELRHEMYFAERKSKKYTYAGNGRAKKMNKLFDYTGKLEMSDGLPVLLVQDNKEDPGSLMDSGIYCIGEEVELSENVNVHIEKKEKRDFTIQISRDFTPKFRLEQYATKIVVKPIDDNRSLFDIYVPMYKSQFNNIQKLFLAELNRIYQGDLRSDTIDFKAVGFVTYNAYGADDFLTFSFKNINFENILKYDGDYVLRFSGDNDIFGYDMLDEMYDEKTEEKSRNHEARKNATITSDTFMSKLNEDKIDEEQVSDLLNGLKDAK